MKKILINIILFSSLFLNIHCQFYKNRVLSDANWSTHMIPLITCALNTDGPILEMGVGDFSTPLLHSICSKNARFILSAEMDENWLNLFLDLEKNWHQFIHVKTAEDWDNIGNEINWSIVFIDHSPGERRIFDIKRLRKNTDIFVVHDSQQPSYGYEPELSSFRYKYIYERYATKTTLVSDKVDIRKFFE
jgi:hypothetical protein